MKRAEVCLPENKYRRFKCLDLTLGEYITERSKNITTIVTYLGDYWARVALQHEYESYEFYLVDDE